MKMSKKTTILLFASLMLTVLPALAQPGAASARGKVVDPENQPIPDALIVFTNPANPDVRYEARTDKKGRYLVSGMPYNEVSKRWDVTVDAQGFLPTHIRVLSRTQTAVIDKFESDIKRGQQIPKITIGGFGDVTADLVLTPADQLAAEEPTVAQGEAAVISDIGPSAGAAPWDAALTAAATGDLEGSLSHFEEALEEKPDDPQRRTAYAKVLYQLERYGPAARQAARATQLAPDSLEAQMVLYSVYVATSNLAGARAVLERALEIAPEDPNVLGQVAFVAEQTGDPQEAIEAYEAITRLDPSNSNAWAALGGLYADTGQSTRSEEAFQKVVELSPDAAYQVFYNIGALILNRPSLTEADQRKAVEAFRKAIEIKPDYARAYQQLAFALLGTGDIEGAGDSLERYLELRPDAADAKDMEALLQGLRK